VFTRARKHRSKRNVIMKIIYGINKIKKFAKPVVAMGVFDGLHRGHIMILKSAAKTAHYNNGTSVVVTFHPHPRRQESLYSLEHRLRLIASCGIDVCIVINFSRHFSAISPRDFIKNILLDKLGAQYVYVGKNFRFGKNASGDCHLLNQLAKEFNFKVKLFPVSQIHDRPISSTAIRSLIKAGDLEHAEKLLTRPVSVLGTVVRGVSLGRELGFPTANINPHHEVLPPAGIYIVKILLDDKEMHGLCYIGSRPTFEGRRQKNIEVYIFNFNKNIYGKYLEVQFIKKIRADKKFPSSEALIKQIKKDVIIAQKGVSLHRAHTTTRRHKPSN